MIKKHTAIKTFNMRMPRDLWIFLKKTAAEQEVSMTDIIIRCVDKYKKNQAVIPSGKLNGGGTFSSTTWFPRACPPKEESVGARFQ